MPDKVTHVEFLAALRTRFPAAAAEVDPRETNTPYSGVSAFHQHTMDAIRAGDTAAVQQCFAFADWLLAHGDAAVVIVLHVSYLEHLAFEGRRTAWAKPLMSPSLSRAWQASPDYMQQFRKTPSNAGLHERKRPPRR